MYVHSVRRGDVPTYQTIHICSSCQACARRANVVENAKEAYELSIEGLRVTRGS